MGPLLDVRKVLERVSAACGVPKRTLTRINAQLKLALTAENGETSTSEQDLDQPLTSSTDKKVDEEVSVVTTSKKIKISTPRKTPRGQQRKRAVTGIDEFGKSAIRQHILQYYERQEVPTLQKLLCGSLMGLGASRVVNMSSPVAEFVTSTISSDTVVIFSKTFCPYCKKAKEVFDKLNQKYTTVELDDREDCSEVQDVLGKLTGARSVPRVFVKGKFVGGGDDVQDLFKKGKLQVLLSSS